MNKHFKPPTQLTDKPIRPEAVFGKRDRWRLKLLSIAALLVLICVIMAVTLWIAEQRLNEAERKIQDAALVSAEAAA